MADGVGLASLALFATGACEGLGVVRHHTRLVASVRGELDTVFVVELWETTEAHQASLVLPQVQAAITKARPLLNGTFGGYRFDVAGSPLRD